MFPKKNSILMNPIKQQIARLATVAKPTNIIKEHAQEVPKYVLSSLREFPSLKPTTFQPVPSSLFNTPIRRDLLWKAVIFDADNARVGASNPKGRHQMGYSNKKLAPQKGTGRARVGDRGSPTRHDGGVALARNAPNFFGTDLPVKVYDRAVRVALSDAYRNGKIFLIDNGELNLPTDDDIAIKMFLRKFDLSKKKLLFITDGLQENLLKATEFNSKKIDVAQKEGVKVKDLLKADKIFIELSSLKYFEEKHGEKQVLK